MNPIDRIICAVDVETGERALELVRALHGHVGVFKVGLELMTSAGISLIPRLRDAGAERIFYDGKLHDIPNTVAGAMRGVARLGAWCVTVHATGGAAMLRAAVETAAAVAAATGGERTLVLAVTVLTSISEDGLAHDLRVAMPMADYVTHLATMARDAGCDGVIASPLEIAAIRAAIPDPRFLIVTPGVRPAGAAIGDQSRVMTPARAIAAGASFLVIGRPIVAATDPASAARAIADEIGRGESSK